RAGGPVRLGTPTPLNWVPESRRAGGPIARPAQGSLASSPAPPAAPSPRGETEKGKDARWASLIRRPAERWLNGGIGVALPDRSRHLNAPACRPCQSNPADWSS